MRKLFVLAVMAAVVAMLLATALVAYADDNADGVVAFTDGGGNNTGYDNPGKAVDEVDNTWVSLGTGGDIAVKFVDNIAVDGPGDDIRIRDRCGGVEEIEVLVSTDGVTFTSLGTFDESDFVMRCSGPDWEADLDINLGDFAAAPPIVSQVKVVDQGELDVLPGVGFDGFDLENVVALNSTELVVDDDANECPGAAYTTIQAAINAASAGETIVVCPGTYSDDLSITTNGVELAGYGSSTTTIEGVAKLPFTSFPLADPNIDIQANDVSIHGFTIKSPVVGASEYSSGIVLTGTSIAIYDNAFLVGTGDVSQGIQTWKDDNAPPGLRDISGLHIHDNTFSHLAPATGVGAYEGIYINSQSDTPTGAVTIKHNVFSGELLRAVTTERSGTVVDSNTMSTDHGIESGVFPRGIQLQAGDNHSVTHNLIDDSGSGVFVTGILVKDGVTDSVIGGSGNTVNGSSANGIEVAGDDNDLENNGAGHNGANGILLTSGATGNTLTHNTAHHNGEDGIRTTDGDNDLFGNNAHHNGGNGIDNNGSGDCPLTGPGPDKNKAKFNEGGDFAGTPGCPNP